MRTLVFIPFLVLAIIGCNKTPDHVVQRSQKTGVPVETSKKIWSLLEDADKADGMTEDQWAQFNQCMNDQDPAVRRDALVILGGISSKKTTQKDRVIAALEKAKLDSDPEVSKGAEGFLRIFQGSPHPM